MPVSEVTASAPALAVKIAGSPMSDALGLSLTEIEVENDLNAPDVATLRFHLNSTNGSVTNLPDSVMKDYLADGAPLEIAHVDGNKEKTIFDGEVVSVGLEYSAHEPGSPMYAMIQAYSRSHRLHRGRKTCGFTNIKASEVASKIAQEHGLKAKVTATTGVYERLFQSRQTDWEFLRQLASRVGYDLFVKGSDLHFQPRDDGGTPLEMEWGKDLLQFSVRANTAFQASEVSVRGWDQEKQQAIIGKATTGKGAPKLGESRTGAAQATAAFKSASVEITNVGVQDQTEAQAVAQAAIDEMDLDHVRAEGTTAGGRGDVLASVAVRIKGVGTRFSGTYVVTASTHRYTAWEGYSTRFTVSGRKDNTLSGLLTGASPASSGLLQGVTIGVVSNLDDPKNLSRVKVQLPGLMADEESDWVRRATPDAGPDRGFQWTPEVGDEVIVAFENGDINRPFVLGSLWNGKAAPPLTSTNAVSGGKVTQRVIQSKAGHVVILDDSDGSEKIIVRDKTKKNEIVLDSKQESISITTGKDLTIKASGKVTLDSGTGDVSISCNNFSVDATQECSLNAKGDLSMTGLNASMEANVGASVKGSATASVEASGQTTIKGAMVMIN